MTGPGETSMLSPLKPLLCRHEFYWSERHRADRCRRCGKTQAADGLEAIAPFETTDAVGRLAPLPEGFFDIPSGDSPPPVSAAPVRHTPSAKVLKAQARERRESLSVLLDRLVEGAQLSRQDALDAILAVIEDAHSADPVLFGPEAVDHFARLHEARRLAF